MKKSGFECLVFVIVIQLPLLLLLIGRDAGPATTLNDGSYTTYGIHALFNEKSGLPVYRFIADKGKFLQRLDGSHTYIDPEPTLKVTVYEIPRAQLLGVTDEILTREHVRVDVLDGIGKIVTH